jgi:hypothetical protein
MYVISWLLELFIKLQQFMSLYVGAHDGVDWVVVREGVRAGVMASGHASSVHCDVCDDDYLELKYTPQELRLVPDYCLLHLYVWCDLLTYIALCALC